MGDIDRGSPMDHYYVHDQNGQMVARPKTPASPGIGGAIKDAVGAIANAVAPRSVVQARPRTDQAVSDND